MATLSPRINEGATQPDVMTGRVLRQLREQLGMSQRQLAPIVGLTRSSLGNRERRNSAVPSTVAAGVRAIQASPPVRSASAYQAECVPTRSVVPRTTPENGDSSAPAHCRSGSLAVVPRDLRETRLFASMTTRKPPPVTMVCTCELNFNSPLKV